MSIQRIVLNINGVDREILCEPEKDSLADVVRRLGLTGTKVGCGTGHCGACSLLLDGEVTRSCVKKMKQVKAYAKVETHRGHRLGGTASSVAAGVHDVCERAVRLLFAGVHHVGQRASDAQS